ncbi:MAG: HAMP domain-containing sensor histidine kinase [Lachnospiraceae bacterium]
MNNIEISTMAILLILFLVGSKYIILKRNLKSVTKELEQLIKDDGIGELHLSSPSICIENFLQVFNKYLRKRKEEDIINRERGQLLKEEIANISHDLRTPLTSMKGYVKLLEDTEITKEEYTQYIEIIERKTNDLGYLVDELYEYASLAEEAPKMQMEEIDLYESFCSQILNYYHDFEERNMQVYLPSGNDKYVIMAERHALNRIFTNLIGNAIKHGKEYFCIKIEKSDQKIQMIFQNPADDLNQEVVKRMFQRFYMQNTKRTASSSGLGLTISQMLMENMHGEMTGILEEGCLKIVLCFDAAVPSAPY